MPRSDLRTRRNRTGCRRPATAPATAPAPAPAPAHEPTPQPPADFLALTPAEQEVEATRFASGCLGGAVLKLCASYHRDPALRMFHAFGWLIDLERYRALLPWEIREVLDQLYGVPGAYIGTVNPTLAELRAIRDDISSVAMGLCCASTRASKLAERYRVLDIEHEFRTLTPAAVDEILRRDKNRRIFRADAHEAEMRGLGLAA